MNVVNKSMVLALVLAAPYAASAAIDEKRTTLEDQSQVAVTIYNQDLALVKDTRKLSLDRGLNALAFREVSARMRPETAFLRSLTHPEGFYLLEQNFDFDLLTPHKLLEKYVGKRVGVVRTHPRTGAEKIEQATVLSVNEGVVLRYADRIEMQAPGRIVFNEVPDNLRDRPTLVTQLNSATEQPQTLELSYLTGGLDWKADYVAELSADDAHLDLNGWVTLTNQSGTTYRNARLQLVAGDVNRVEEAFQAKVERKRLAERTLAKADTGMSEEGLFEYHLYSLNRATTIAENQTKQVALMSAASVPVSKEFLLKGADYYYHSSYGDLGQKLKVGVFVEFDNKESSHLGLPLPKGIVRVYKKDSGGNAQFVGEDRIDHTPKNEKIRLKLGDAFDVTANKTQTRFKRRPATGAFSYVFDASFTVQIKNAKKEAVTVTVLEPIPGDWMMIKESHPHEQAAAGTARWRVTVPPEGETTLSYTVKVRY